MANNYYVYFLKDPREKPAKTFYIGKGTGSRATDHLKMVDETRKGKYIKEIIDSGNPPLVCKIIENLSEEQAYRVELELISSFGTIDTGGSLYNSVIPKSIKRRVDNSVVVPLGSVEQAQLGLRLLKNSILSLAEENPNAKWSYKLGLRTLFRVTI